MTIQQEIVTLASSEDGIDTYKNKKEIEIGLDFILSHLENPTIFPGTIMTKKLGYQRIIYSKERGLEHFIESDCIDCRINAFPSLKEGTTWPPNLLFIDLDLADFNSSSNNNNKKALKLALNKTLKNIKEKLNDNNAHPSVLWSGNGYHIILPVYCPKELEHIPEFQEFDNPSERFLRFAKDFLSNGKADKANYPSFRSCLLRIPNSLNGKCLARNESLDNSKIKIIQEWNGYRPPIKELLYGFRDYMIQKKIDEYNYRQKILLNARRSNNNNNNRNYYEWIENILERPFEDCRKLIVDLILTPYLINIKKLSYQESYQIIRMWLDKCDSLKRLDNTRNFNYRISYALRNAMNKQTRPMSFQKVKMDNNYRRLYILIKQKGRHDIRE